MDQPHNKRYVLHSCILIGFTLKISVKVEVNLPMEQFGVDDSKPLGVCKIHHKLNTRDILFSRESSAQEIGISEGSMGTTDCIPHLY